MPVPTPAEIDQRNRQTINYFMPFWTNAYRINAEQVNIAMRNKQYAHSVPFNGKNIKGVIIVASGPSLMSIKDDLKQLNEEYLIIACPTNYAFCLAHGLVPDIITIADSSPTQVRDIFSVIEHSTRTSIVCSPNVHPDIHKIFPEEQIYWTKTYVQSKDGTLNNPFNDFQKMLFRNIPDHVLQAGNVTNMALILLELFRKSKRYEEIPQVFFLGYDLACIPETFRAPKYYQEGDGTFNFVAYPEIERDTNSKYLIKHEDQITTTQMYGYRRSVLMLWQTVPWQLFKCTDTGLLKEVPYVPISDLAKGFLPEKQPDELRKNAWKNYQDTPYPTAMDGSPLDHNLDVIPSNTDITVAGSELNPTNTEGLNGKE